MSRYLTPGTLLSNNLVDDAQQLIAAKIGVNESYIEYDNGLSIEALDNIIRFTHVRTSEDFEGFVSDTVSKHYMTIVDNVWFAVALKFGGLMRLVDTDSEESASYLRVNRLPTLIHNDVVPTFGATLSYVFDDHQFDIGFKQIEVDANQDDVDRGVFEYTLEARRLVSQDDEDDELVLNALRAIIDNWQNDLNDGLALLHDLVVNTLRPVSE